jgi:hypothetical protein
MKKMVQTLAATMVLAWSHCSGERLTSIIKPSGPVVEIWQESWDNGNARFEFQYYLDAAGAPLKHGYYKEYSRFVNNLLTVEGRYTNGVKTGQWYTRCNPGPLPPVFKNGGFENANFSGWMLDGVEKNRIDLIASDDPQRGQYSAKLTLVDNRVELVRMDPDSYQQERIYNWSFKIDEDFGEEPYWMVINQFHSQPDFPKGETWATYPAFRPPVSISYAEGHARLLVIPLDQVVVTLGSFPVEKGKWFDIYLQIKWSLGDDGYIEMYVDGKPVTRFNGVDYKHYGPNVHNEVGNFLKVGLYRDRRATQVNSVYIDNLTIDDC